MIKRWGHYSPDNPQGWGSWDDTYFSISVVIALCAIALFVILEATAIFLCGFASIFFPGVCHVL